MKRSLSLLVALVLILSCIVALPASAAPQVDFSRLDERSDLFALEVDDDGDAFIQAKLSRPSFTHKNSPDGIISQIYSDILVLNYYTAPSPVWRIWINYTAPEALGITSVSMVVDNIECTFDISSTEIIHFEDCVLEAVPIVMGKETFQCWLPMLEKRIMCNSLEELQSFHVPVTLHGATEDVTFDLPVDGLLCIAETGSLMIALSPGAIVEEPGTKMTTRELSVTN